MIFFLALVMITTVSCSDSKDEVDNAFVQSAHVVKGTIEKGPFVRGTNVEMRTMDKNMSLTGSSYTAIVEDNAGNFNYGSLKMDSPYARLSANGYFFNEVKGLLSASTIQLDGIVDLTDNQTINVNILTHLKSQRVLNLVTKEGKSFEEANRQAQDELLSAFGLQDYTKKDVSRFSIADGDDAAGALIAVSSLVQANRSEAEIVEFLARLTTDFGTSGKFSEDDKKDLRESLNFLNYQLGTIRENIIQRYKELGQNISVKDLAYYFDWNNDGIAGNELDETPTVTLDKNKLNVPASGGEYTVTIQSDKPYYLNNPLNDNSPDNNLGTNDFLSDLYETNTEDFGIRIEKLIEGNILKLNVQPANFSKPRQENINIYNARGNIVAKIIISQDGNPTNYVDIKLGETGKNYFNDIMLTLSQAFDKIQSLEKSYVYVVSHKPYTSHNPTIQDVWYEFYSAIRLIITMKKADAKGYSCYQEYLDTYLAIVYYTMSAYWGGVPYVNDIVNEPTTSFPRTNERELMKILSENLTKALPYTRDKRNDTFSDINSALFVSKDVVRTMLAYIKMNQNDYKEALNLLQQVIDSGHYHISKSLVYTSSDECILGFLQNGITGNSLYPCLDYRDVILAAAECNYHIGNVQKARQYINQVSMEKGISIDNQDIMKSIAQLKYTMKSPYYLPFIRRNNLGKSELGLASNQLYQLLFPIPRNELSVNSQMIQNPGY